MEHMKALDDELQIDAAGGAEKGEAGTLSTVDRMELKLGLCPKCHISIKNIGRSYWCSACGFTVEL